MTIAVEVSAAPLLGRVLLPHLADLAAPAAGHAIHLERSDQRRQLGRPDVVLPLLLVERRLGETQRGGRVDGDVAIAGLAREPGGAPDLLRRALRVIGVRLGVELVVVTL